MTEDTEVAGNYEGLYTGFEKKELKDKNFDFNKHPDEFIIGDPDSKYFTYTMNPITISGELYIPSYMSKSYKIFINEIKKIDPSGVFFADLSGVTDVEEDDTIINRIKEAELKNTNFYENDKDFPFHNRYKKVKSYNPKQIKPNDVDMIGNVILKLIELNENKIFLEIHLEMNQLNIPLIGTYDFNGQYNIFDIYDYLKNNENELNDVSLKNLFEEIFPMLKVDTSFLNEENISMQDDDTSKPDEAGRSEIISKIVHGEPLDYDENMEREKKIKEQISQLKQRIEELLKKNEQQPKQQPEQQLKPTTTSTPGDKDISFTVSFDSNANIVKVEINKETFGDGTYIVDPKDLNNKPETSGGEKVNKIDKIYSFVYNTGDKSIKYANPESTSKPLSIEDGNNTFIWDIQSGGEVQVPKSLNDLEGKEIQVIIGSGDGMGMVNNTTTYKRDSGKTNVEAYWNTYGTNRKNVIQIHCCDKNYEGDEYIKNRPANIDYVKKHNLQGNIVICYIDLIKPDQLKTFLETVTNIHLLRTDDKILYQRLAPHMWELLERHYNIDTKNQTLDDLIRKYDHINNFLKTSLKTAIETILNKKESLESKTTLSVIPNNGVPPNTNMTNQCFWISIADWYKIKDPTNKPQISVPVLRDFAKNLNAGKINDETQLMTISDFTNNNFDLIRAFAVEKNIYIRIFYYDPVNRALQLGDCEQKGFDTCKGRVFDFGNVTATDYVLIVAYGSHFELITECKQGKFNYNINDNKDQKITNNKTLKESRHYNDEGKIVPWNELNIEEKIEILRGIDHSLNKFQPKPTPS